jgi:hypothetical protein
MTGLGLVRETLGEATEASLKGWIVRAGHGTGCSPVRDHAKLVRNRATSPEKEGASQKREYYLFLLFYGDNN